MRIAFSYTYAMCMVEQQEIVEAGKEFAVLITWAAVVSRL